jgi:hypothetical protein
MAAFGPFEGPGGGRHAWLTWVLFFAAVMLIVSRPWAASDAPPASTSADDSHFSAARAWTHVDALATMIGRRVSGTEACVRAADYIEAQLHALRVETERQVASGEEDLDGTTYVYRGVENVLARIPGRATPAVLVSAHYDSAIDGPGAGDNVLNVAAALEIVRAIRTGGVPGNTIIFNFNGAEEPGLLGAAAFVHHAWFKEVAAVVNLDASGPAGRQLLLQASVGRNDLLRTYAASAPHVHGTVLAQEVFQVLPLDTDYHVYREAGMSGIDLVPYGDSYAYHTSLDRSDRLSRRTLQESGDNVLALLRGLPALSPATRHETGARATYYDLLGLVMVRYSMRTAQAIGLLVSALALVLACRPRPGARYGFAMIALGSASVAASALFAMLLPILGSILVTLAGQSMFWFARPWLALCVYGPCGAAGVLAGQSLLRSLARRRGLAPSIVTDAVRRGLVVWWALLLLVTTALQLGSGYLLLWWCAGSAIALVASTHLSGARRWIVTLAGLTLAAVTTMQASEVVLTCMVPFTGILGREVPADRMIAAISALIVAPFALSVAPLMQAVPSPRRAGACAGGALIVMAGLVASSFPYTPERPKRAYVDVRNGGEGGAHAVVETIDSGPEIAVKDVPLPDDIGWPMPAIEALPALPGEPAQRRVVEIRLNAPGAYQVDVRLGGRTIAWRIGERTDERTHFVWVGTRDPLTLRVEVAPGASGSIHAKAFYPGSAVSVENVLARLPRWSTATVQTVLETSATF